MPSPSNLARASIRCALLAAALAAAHAPQDTPGGQPGGTVPPAPGEADDSGFVELDSARERYWVGETIPVRVRFGIEAGLLAERLVPLFRRPLDLPVQLVPRGALADAGLGPPPAGSGDAAGSADPGGTTGTTGTTGAAGAAGAADSAVAAAIAGSRTVTFALGDEVGRARLAGEQQIGERRFTVLEVAGSVRAQFAGSLDVPAPELRFAVATPSRDDVVQGRVPESIREVRVAGPPLVVEVAPLPDAGRPATFTGAVGRLSVSARARPLTVPAGGLLELELHVTCADGPVGDFDPPRLGESDGLPGFDVLGWSETSTAAGRTVTYTLSPRAVGTARVPPIAFAYFDTAPPAGYRTAWTDPIAIEVVPNDAAAAPPGRAAGGAADAGGPLDADGAADAGGPLDADGAADAGGALDADGAVDAGGAPDASDAADADGARPSLDAARRAAPADEAAPDAAPADASATRWPSAALLAAGVVALAVAVAGGARIIGRRRAAAAALGDPRVERVRGAAAAFRARAAGEEPAEAGPDATRDFIAFLAACLGRPPSAVIGADLAARLARAGLRDDLARRAADRLDELLATRYGGADARREEEQLVPLVDEIERALVPRS